MGTERHHFNEVQFLSVDYLHYYPNTTEVTFLDDGRANDPKYLKGLQNRNKKGKKVKDYGRIR